MDESLANAFVAAHIVTLEELAYVPIGELLAIDGLNELEVHSFRQRAREYLLRDALGPKGQRDG
jgi:N utilization substance protein A